MPGAPVAGGPVGTSTGEGALEESGSLVGGHHVVALRDPLRGRVRRAIALAWSAAAMLVASFCWKRLIVTGLVVGSKPSTLLVKKASVPEPAWGR